MNNKTIKIVVVIAVIFAAGAVVIYKAVGTPASPVPCCPNPDGQIQPDVKLPKMIDFGREKCAPCVAMMPILEALKIKYKDRAIVEFVNTEKQRNLAFEYGIEVVPTQIFFDADGKEVWRHEGFLSQEKIEEQFGKMGVE